METNLRIALICFHKNISQYPQEWIEEYRASILNQTFNKFTIFEMNYGNTTERIFDNSMLSVKDFTNHVLAHNKLLDDVFSLGYDYAINSNCDDKYAINRIEKQLPYMEQGYDVISSNFYNINDRGEIRQQKRFHDKDIIAEANKNHNIICHPVVCYSKHFWTTCSRLNPDEIPEDDFNLWKRSYGNYKFVIVPHFLAYYRVHQFKVCNR